MIDVERFVSRVEGREYLCISRGSDMASVQDFVRWPRIIAIDEEVEVTQALVDSLRKNSRRPTASAVVLGKFDEVWVTGDPSYPLLAQDGHTAIGVGDASVSSLVSHGIATDITGSSMAFLQRSPKKLPVGLFEVASARKVVDMWASRGMVGMYRRPLRNDHVLKNLSSGTTTELYAAGPAATAVHYAVSHLGARRIVLHECDRTFGSIRDGAVPFDGRYAYPWDIHGILTLHAVCLVAIRNHIEVAWHKGTMAAVPCADRLD